MINKKYPLIFLTVTLLFLIASVPVSARGDETVNSDSYKKEKTERLLLDSSESAKKLKEKELENMKKLKEKQLEEIKKQKEKELERLKEFKEKWGTESGKRASDSASREELKKDLKEQALAIVKRLKEAAAKEESLAARIQSRITKMKSEGKNMAEAETTLAEANVKLAKVKADISALESKVSSADSSTTTPETIRSHMTEVKNIKKGLIDTHKTLQSTVRYLMGIGNRGEKEGSKSATKSASPSASLGGQQ